jgi:hypothetical protein
MDAPGIRGERIPIIRPLILRNISNEHFKIIHRQQLPNATEEARQATEADMEERQRFVDYLDTVPNTIEAEEEEPEDRSVPPIQEKQPQPPVKEKHPEPIVKTRRNFLPREEGVEIEEANPDGDCFYW